MATVKQSEDEVRTEPVTEEVSATPGDSVPRRVVYSPETTAAYGAVIDAAAENMTKDNLSEIDRRLRHLAMMVHCDFTGELRAPHTHTATP